MGTRMSADFVEVIDGDTIKVRLSAGDGTESLRLIALDTEEKRQISADKPKTRAGELATQFAEAFFAGADAVEVEFDTDDPLEECLVRHRGNYGRLICYVWRDGTNYNLEAVRRGYSPYFVKYGRSRLYHREFSEAEAAAMAAGPVIWDPMTNAGGPSRDYATLLPWWDMRAHAVDDYRAAGLAAGVMSVRLDYPVLEQAARDGRDIVVFADLQGGVHRSTDAGAVIFAGSRQHPFNLWVPNADSGVAEGIVRLVNLRYAGRGRGYVYVKGAASLYRDRPQIVLTEATQLSDFP